MEPNELFNWYAFFVDFQAAIIGVVGFAGVIRAQYVNARLTRERDDRNLQVRRHAVCCALHAELKMFRKAFKNTSESELPNGSQTSNLGKLRRNISMALSGDLGLIPEDALPSVVHALGAIDGASQTYALLATTITEDHFVFRAQNFKLATIFAKGMVTQLDTAIAMLEPHSAKA
jgi:hypothetical protein